MEYWSLSPSSVMARSGKPPGQVAPVTQLVQQHRVVGRCLELTGEGDVETWSSARRLSSGPGSDRHQSERRTAVERDRSTFLGIRTGPGEPVVERLGQERHDDEGADRDGSLIWMAKTAASDEQPDSHPVDAGTAANPHHDHDADHGEGERVVERRIVGGSYSWT